MTDLLGKTDIQLINEFLNGEEKAFEVLIGRYLKPIYNFVWRLCGNKEEAQDITQETFFKAWKNIKKYDKNQSFQTWIFSIARNTAIDWLRKKKNLVFSDFESEKGENILIETIADPSPLPDELVIRAEKQEFLENAIDKLSPLYREVLLLRYNEYLTFEEISSILKKPVNTVKSQYRRSLILLRQQLLNN